MNTLETVKNITAGDKNLSEKFHKIRNETFTAVIVLSLVLLSSIACSVMLFLLNSIDPDIIFKGIASGVAGLNLILVISVLGILTVGYKKIQQLDRQIVETFRNLKPPNTFPDQDSIKTPPPYQLIQSNQSEGIKDFT